MHVRIYKFALWAGLSAIAAGCTAPGPLQVSSPNGELTVVLTLQEGTPHYRIELSGRPLLAPSRLGFSFKNAAALRENLEIAASSSSSFDETWEQPWGEVRHIRNHYNQLRVELKETQQPGRRLDIVFRAFDDGVGFRYEIPEQENLNDFEIMDEHTEFALTGAHRSWWIPAYGIERYEYLYRETPADQIEVVHTPLTMETKDGIFLSIHEAALADYAAMTLKNTGGNVLEADLVPWLDGSKVKGSSPLKTPWRTIQVARKPGDLITSYLILNLNEPNRLADVSWIEPGKYVGIWWGMHLGVYSWASGEKHGATTARTKKYIDFAAENGFAGVLVEGWNEGWDGDWMVNGHKFKFSTPYPDYDIEELSRYAAEKGVRLIGHHETSFGIDNYESQLDEAFAFAQRLGINRIKTGYVGNRVKPKQWQHGQYMVRHYRKVVEKAAEYGIMLNVHEPIKDTGIRRTYPNMMTREGGRGMEYSAWSGDGGNPPDHTVLLPFTRMLSGPFDFTPGIFDLLFEEAKPDNRVNSTLAKQLAYYVVIYSPMQMAADLIENYSGQPAFQFIRDVPCDWEETLVLHAQIGDFVTFARKDRNGPDWYIGSITDENARSLEAELAFLDAGTRYLAEIYADGPHGDWQGNPYDIEIRRELVDSSSKLTLRLAAGGGQAIRLRPATEQEIAELSK